MEASHLPWRRREERLSPITSARRYRAAPWATTLHLIGMMTFKNLNVWDPIRTRSLIFVMISKRKIMINPKVWCFSSSKWIARKTLNSFTLKITWITNQSNILSKIPSVKRCQTSSLGLCLKKFIRWTFATCQKLDTIFCSQKGPLLRKLISIIT